VFKNEFNTVMVSMVLEADSKVYSRGDAKTLHVVVPADVVVDSQFPFKDGDRVHVKVEGDRIVVTRIKK